MILAVLNSMQCVYEHHEHRRLSHVQNVLLYVASEDGAFLNHRLPMARAALRAGFEVHVATQATTRAKELSSEGFKVHAIPFKRGGLNPLSAIATIREIRSVERLIKPHVVHHSSLQSCIFGSIAAFGTNIWQINAFTGLGYAFTSRSAKATITRLILTVLLKTFANRARSVALVQNPDDRAVLKKLGFASERIVLVPGSGVDTDAFRPLAEPPGPITLGFAGRLLVDKGIRSLVAAHKILTDRGLDIRLLIAGEPDPSNPASIPLSEIENWRKDPRIALLGHIDDIEQLWRNAHIAVLPSHREGLPKSLLEAAAYGRPLIATDAPGCREIAIEDQTGLLVPIEEPAPLSEAIVKLAQSRELRARYGDAARRLVEEKMSSRIIGDMTVALYRSLH